jgi:hypothetical protein
MLTYAVLAKVKDNAARLAKEEDKLPSQITVPKGAGGRERRAKGAGGRGERGAAGGGGGGGASGTQGRLSRGAI